MSFINSIFSWIITKRIHQIELFIKHPHDVQNDVFNYLIKESKHTEWGETHGYSNINSISSFKKNVPLNNYEGLKSFIDRERRGEKDILWPGETKWFAKSSGTTSDKSKFIPVSKESLEDCHFKGGKDMLALYHHNKQNTKIFEGKSLVVGGSTQINPLHSDGYYGDLSAIIIKNLPFWVEYKRTPNISIALLSEWENKINKMAQQTSQEDVTNISGVPSWTKVLLQKVLEITGAKTVKEVWPNLELFMHGGVSFLPYKKSYEKLIGINTPIDYLETYNASEGFFGIQYKQTSSEILLMLDYGIFYEFIPKSEWDKENPKTILLDQVKTNEVYEMVISTNAGLWRYRIGDTITFTSLSPFMIKVAGRTKHFINAFGEELMINNSEKALEIVCKKLDIEITDYTAGPYFYDDGEKGYHEWVIELNKQLDESNAKVFTKLLDEELKKLNSDYEAKRHKNMLLQLPKIHFLPKGSFYDWMKKRGKLGGQNKVPRLSNSRKFVDGILDYINT